MAFDVLFIIAILAAAIVPPLIYLIWVRDTEVCRREPYSALLRAFLFGATISVAISYVVESLAMTILYSGNSPLALGFWNFAPFDPTLQTVILAVIIAPVVEETAKALGVLNSSRRILEIEDGIIYGAAVGLGFAAAENILYLASAMTEGVEVFALTAVVRALTSTVLHASATAIVGYGIALAIFSRRSGMYKSWWPYLLMAILLHASFNLFATLSLLFTSAETLSALLGLALSFLLSWTIFTLMRRKIRQLDRVAPSIEGPKTGPL